MPHIFSSYIGVDTEVHVEFDYQPQELAITHPIQRAHPGMDEKCTVTAVYIDGEDIMHELNEKALDRLTDAAYSYVYSQKRCAEDANPFLS